MKVWYFIRTFAWPEEFPEAHLFATEAGARAAMIAEAQEAAEHLEGWLTSEIDGPPIDQALKDGSAYYRHLTRLNVQRSGGKVDCFRLGSQDIHAEEIGLSLDFGEVEKRVYSNLVRESLDAAQRHHQEQEALTGAEMRELDERRADLNEMAAEILDAFQSGDIGGLSVIKRWIDAKSRFYACPTCGHVPDSI